MHTLHSAFILGYHGCDRAVGERILGGAAFKQSDNDYDWLGSGIYFWEANPLRGLEFAREVMAREQGGSAIKDPYVIGAIIEPRLCLDLMTSSGIELLKNSYTLLHEIAEFVGYGLPKNSEDLMLRKLDCAVVKQLHNIREMGDEPPVDTVKGMFVEGDEIYPGSGFREKNHIQLCVRNTECIKGVFRVEDRFLKQ